MIRRAAAAFIVFLFVTTAHSVEQQCTDLGANCICSEPLQGTMVLDDIHWINPSDSTTKECTLDGNPGDAVRVPNSNSAYFAASDTSVLNLLPTGHSVSQYLRSNDGQIGGYHIGHILSSGDPVARVALRFYRYYSSNCQLTGEGSCTNGKVANMHRAAFGAPQFTTSHTGGPTGTIQTYAMGAGWTTGNNDCCFEGPNIGAGMTHASFKGAWWRFEFVIQNRRSGPSTAVLYRKKVTVGNTEPEEIVIDTRTQDLSTGPEPWTTALATGMVPSEDLAWIDSDAYRAGTCTGYMAHMYSMVAAWSTDTGQRIGAASEVEGGAGQTGSVRGAVIRGGVVK